MAEPGVRFIYLPAADLAAMRAFYSEVLGLEEIWFRPREGVAYDCQGLQFTILFDERAVPSRFGWATQPGWQGDTTGQISWSVVLSEAGFRQAVSKLMSLTVPRLHETPQWVDYWSFPVQDPMGNTVELSWPATEPAGSTWVD